MKRKQVSIKDLDGYVTRKYQELIDKSAREIRFWLEDAVGDMAQTPTHLLDDDWRKKVERAEREGVIDVRGWLADEYFNDEDMLHDLCGDRIYDEATEISGYGFGDEIHDHVYVSICESMKKMSHPALVRALDKLADYHRKRLKEIS